MAKQVREKAAWLSLTEAGFPKDLAAARKALRDHDAKAAEARKPLMAAFIPLADAYVTSKLATFAAAANDPMTPKDVKEQCNNALQILRADTEGKIIPGYSLGYSFRFGCGVAALPTVKGKQAQAFKL